MKRPNRLTIFSLIILGVLIFITLFAAPSGGKLNNGSTYNRAPEGYGAWYNYMQRRGKIERWQRPAIDIKSKKDLVTLLQVNPPQFGVAPEYELQGWIEKGNNLIVLDYTGKATGANFSTIHKSSAGNVKIDTTKRYKISFSKSEVEPLLSDDRGAIVWQARYGKGKVIYSVTPELAANAYQNEPGNFEFLAQLASDNNKRKIYIDEYIHGYKDKDIKEAKGEGNIQTYFIQKPIFTAFIQAGILLLVLIFAQNRRFGKIATLEAPKVDNSQAYIQALAAVLQKADSTDFVVEMVGKEEINQLTLNLGLGKKNLIDITAPDSEELLSVWQNKFGAGSDVESALRVQSQQGQRRLSEKDLIAWLRKWGNIRKYRRD
ncbi:hypothetical protein DSM106972_057560 [Dulcicalothrix desertica PCC 7102]|uniref:DUF4350 domain-containing protein n=1 Tax=Dulcicalothrix desertica PCC 7102 TaxID=232991 RepID=A0A433V9P9_9CYAN|nr:DUF4350 domain-containing protein [Dulcicalothrix desertica]RUT02836.1 hypothetical protein DSM106972_057560 [Dulcicalothrix desertica PCC 7102]TWH38931.1 hypothetical protein CAL7102_08128 [Dulcicalothrix desertica PCC 7102]